VNDTWFSAWNSMPDKRPSILSTFLGYITRNFAIDRFKLKNARKRGGGEMPLALDELEECISSPVDPAQEIEQKELESAVDAFVNGLPDTERIMFIARYWFLIPVAEISERMGCSQSKTKTTLYRTRNKLRTYLQGEGLC
jgi:RNA polymerase sigma-70 factor (ECF subfamily)